MSSWLAFVLRSRVMVCMVLRSSLMDSNPATISLRLVNETAWEYSASCSVTILPLAWRMLFKLISSSSKLVLRILLISSFVLLRYNFTSFRLTSTLLGSSLVPSCMYSFVTKAHTTPNLQTNVWNIAFVRNKRIGNLSSIAFVASFDTPRASNNYLSIWILVLKLSLKWISMLWIGWKPGSKGEFRIISRMEIKTERKLSKRRGFYLGR